MFIVVLMALSWSLRIILMPEGKPERDSVLTWTRWRAGSDTNDKGRTKALENNTS